MGVTPNSLSPSTPPSDLTDTGQEEDRLLSELSNGKSESSQGGSYLQTRGESRARLWLLHWTGSQEGWVEFEAKHMGKSV